MTALMSAARYDNVTAIGYRLVIYALDYDKIIKRLANRDPTLRLTILARYA